MSDQNMSSQTSERFKCNECGMKFGSQNDLNEHNKQTHPSGGEEQLRDGGRA
jgi:uncharacterized C2H2 Zn-finger protein